MIKNTDHSLVSIIIPTYNRAHVLGKAIDSVFEQTYENWELIVVDDASIDNTIDMMKNYTDDRIKYIREEKNRGANYCRNIGVKNSKGAYLAFLDSDNYWDKRKLEIQVKEIEKAEDNVAFVFCGEAVNDGDKEYVVPDKHYSESEIKQILYEKNIIDTNVVLIKRKCFEQVGGFDEKMVRYQDWELFFRVINVYGYKALYIPICLNTNIFQKDSITKSMEKHVDGMFCFLSKYPECFSNELVEHYIQHMLVDMEGEEEYICKEIYKYFSTNANVIQNTMKNMQKSRIDFRDKLFSQRRLYDLLYEWKKKNGKKEKNTVFYELFSRQEKTIAIYGLGNWGELFYQEIKNLPVKILYGIDKKVDFFHSLQIRRPTDELEKVDMIVVTVFQEYKEIKEELQKKYQGEIVSIEQLIRLA